MKITNQTRKKWFLENKCHVCGNNQPHTHPEWMWLANPVPALKNRAPEERKKMAQALHRINKATLEIIVGGH